ncbi:hypothetical protein NP233_g7522 [Leucocoprinus birnbaumii]|uniref:Uncharacterized protein n=1 Tax=Leucocoprinus birnbaumii TaxID=56174 RepID=A0AAD5VP26_9AGAR|nr:hypothetical protein NP233_g7522 [Leucocoprinus birnbaumii]
MARLPHFGTTPIANHPPILNVDPRRDLPAPVAISNLQLYFPYPPTPPPSLADEETWLLASRALHSARHGGRKLRTFYHRLKSLIKALLCCGCIGGQGDLEGRGFAEEDVAWRPLYGGGRSSCEPLLTSANTTSEGSVGGDDDVRAVVAVEAASESPRSSSELDIVDILGPKLPPIEIFVQTHTQIHYQPSSHYLH